MSIFYDYLIDLEILAKKVNSSLESTEEKEEMWQLIDEMIHHRVVGCILDRLPSEHHNEFIGRLTDEPYNSKLVGYLVERIGDDIEELIRKEVGTIEEELLSQIFGVLEDE